MIFFLFIDIPVISGHSVINFTNGFDIMVSYYSHPKDNTRHLYLGDIKLVQNDPISNAVIPLLFHRTVASIDGKVMIITVHNAGIYRYSIQNDHGTTVGTINVWSSKTEESTTGRKTYISGAGGVGLTHQEPLSSPPVFILDLKKFYL